MKEVIKKVLKEYIIEDRKARGYWNAESLKQEADKYETLQQFRENSESAYKAAIKLNILDYVVQNLKKTVSRKPKGFWTKENIYKEAQKYKKLNDFIRNSETAWKAARKLNDPEFYSHIISHMEKMIPWTKEMVKKEVDKYDNLQDFRKNSSSAYSAVLRNKWNYLLYPLDRIQNQWTFDEVKKIASKYRNKRDFRSKDRKAYDIATYHKWLPEITKHMEVLGNRKRRLIYAFEFEDKSVYVGLTYDKDKRKEAHLKSAKSAVFQHMRRTGLKPTMKIVTHDFIDVKDAQNLEHCTIEKYKNEGWNILNVAKAGALGYCEPIYTFDIVKKESEKYKTISDFAEKSPRHYSAMVRNRWTDEIGAGLESKLITWTLDMVRNIADKYETWKEFSENEPKALDAARRNKWVDDISSHLNKKIYWTPEKIKKEAIKYKTKKEFADNSVSAYHRAKKLGIFDEVTKNMVSGRLKWTKDKIKDLINSYQTKTDFIKNEPAAYQAAQKYGWYDELSKNKPSKYRTWTQEDIENELSKFNSLDEFRKNDENTFQVIKRKIGLERLMSYYN